MSIPILERNPGKSLNVLFRMKYNNGILFFDEFDKIEDKSTILSTLLHITDFKQNHAFKDHFMPEIPNRSLKFNGLSIQ